MANDGGRRMPAHDLQQFGPALFASDPRFLSIGSSQEFPNNLLCLRVLRRIFVGSVNKNVRIQAVHDRNQASPQIFSIQRFPKIFGGTKNSSPSEGRYPSLRFIRLRASGQTLFDSTANKFAHRSVLQLCQSPCIRILSSIRRSPTEIFESSRDRLLCDLRQLRQRRPDWIARTCLGGPAPERNEMLHG